MTRIGIRHEDKSRWEGRAPLVPDDIRTLIQTEDLAFTVQPSPARVLGEAQYRQAGARIDSDLADCPIILGVKEIPLPALAAGKTYVYFSHTIKGQRASMPALARLLELGCTLIDYERITDDAGHRLVFFGRFAGLAGMIDSLWALGRRLAHEGFDGPHASPFALIQPAHRYADLETARRAVAALGDRLRAGGVPAALRPCVCGFAGYGQVSSGAQEIFDALPVEEVAPADLASLPPSEATCYKVVFHEEHLVRRRDASRPFELQEYYDHPERYASDFFQYAPHLTMLVNCIYWEPKYPRLLTREQLAALWSDTEQPPRLRVIGDISCDVDGSLACTVRATDPDAPVYVYDPATGATHDGVAGRGPVVLAVDFLPCELPVDASVHFSRAFTPFVPGLARADLTAGELAAAGLPAELERATIVYRGALTEPYRYLSSALAG